MFNLLRTGTSAFALGDRRTSSSSKQAIIFGMHQVVLDAVGLWSSAEVINGIAGVTRACPRARPARGTGARSAAPSAGSRLGDIARKTLNRPRDEEALKTRLLLALSSESKARVIASSPASAHTTCWLLSHVAGAGHVCEDATACVEDTSGGNTRAEVSSTSGKGGGVHAFAP